MMVIFIDERAGELRKHGIEVLRIPNQQLIQDSESTQECIKAAIARRMER